MRRNNTILILAFPLVLSIGIILIPVVTDYSDHHLAAQAVEKTWRWVAGHLISAVAFGLGVLATSAIFDELRRKSYAVPMFLPIFIAIGAGLYAAGLGVDGIGPVVVNSFGSPVAFFDASGWWVTGVFVAGTLFFGLGLISVVIHGIRAGLVTGVWRYVVFVSALIFVSAPAILSGWSLYGVSLASIGVFVPIGHSVERSA